MSLSEGIEEGLGMHEVRACGVVRAGTVCFREGGEVEDIKFSLAVCGEDKISSVRRSDKVFIV